LDIRFRGESVSGAELVVIRIFNSGHLPINVSDYQTNLAIVVNPGATILDAHIIETTPADLEERLKLSDAADPLIERVEAGKLLLRPILLNDTDSFTVQLLVLNLQGQIAVTGHVQGINRVKPWHENRLVPILLTQLGVVIMAGAMLAVQPNDIATFQFEHVTPFVFLFLLGYTCLNAGQYWPRKRERRL
jgi:hypothetical protein